jgi:protein-L-isoaspartate O-methyltransferase
LLLPQLKVGGRMILPLELELDGQYRQDLFLIKKTSSEKLEYIPLIPVKFVPLL